jgi:oligoribonuclease NrnB/cAMP/cGMP phosphodiesterase (DHH superfamily)
MSEKKIFNYIIYHSGCLDGFSGFFVAHISGRLSKDVYIHEDVPSTNRVPLNIDNKDIVIIDVAYKKEVMEEIFKHAKSVVFIDHHVTTNEYTKILQQKYNKNENIKIVYDEKRCGSTLAWSYFFGRQKIPLFLKYVEDQDIGKWEYPKTRPFIFAIKVYYRLSTESKSLNKWFKLLNKETVTKLIKKGKTMKRYNDYIVNVNVPKHTMESFPSKKVYAMKPGLFKKPGQYKVVVYCGHNCPSVTELAIGALDKIPEADFCIMWVYNLDSKKYVLSMRSRDVDVASICGIFGGGGHKLAAACSFQASTMKFDDLFEGSSLPRSIGSK